PRSKNTATCFPTAGNPHKNSRPKSGRLSFYGLPAIADGCTSQPKAAAPKHTATAPKAGAEINVQPSLFDL
ncbi:hypothetical protein, partial [Sangeribacter muris]|uniref:hypothetical protein n=1 Tax=Sangeribacter muris TaxID=2880703 RepID=UPI00244E1075